MYWLLVTFVQKVLERDFECCQSKTSLSSQVKHVIFGCVMVVQLHIIHICGMVFQVAGQQRKLERILEN
jgi:hypothetical protein